MIIRVNLLPDVSVLHPAVETIVATVTVTGVVLPPLRLLPGRVVIDVIAISDGDVAQRRGALARDHVIVLRAGVAIIDAVAVRKKANILEGTEVNGVIAEEMIEVLIRLDDALLGLHHHRHLRRHVVGVDKVAHTTTVDRDPVAVLGPDLVPDPGPVDRDDAADEIHGRDHDHVARDGNNRLIGTGCI